MSKRTVARTQRRGSARTPLERTVPRREALKGLGALAISLPVLGSAACSEEAPDDDGSGIGGAGTGGAPGLGNGGALAASPARSSGAPSVTTGGGAGGTNGAGAGGAGAGGAGGAGDAGAGAGGTDAVAGQGGAGSGGMGGAGAASGDDFVTVTFDEVATCTLTPTDPAGEGPFFIHEDEVMDDPSLLRTDLRDGRDGVELQLNLRVLDSEGDCMTPIGGVEVYVWHTDAMGFYSGFDGQNPDQTYSGGFERTIENADRFCRGVQVTDAQGTMSYRGDQYMVFTTQMYFEEQLSRMVHENNAPYSSRIDAPGYTQYVRPQNDVVVPTASMQGDVVVAALNLVTAGTGSRR